jgi:hypothetical protein
VKEVTPLRRSAAAHQTARNNVTDIQISNTMGARPHDSRVRTATTHRVPPTAQAPDRPVGPTYAPTHVLHTSLFSQVLKSLLLGAFQVWTDRSGIDS